MVSVCCIFVFVRNGNVQESVWRSVFEVRNFCDEAILNYDRGAFENLCGPPL